MRSRSRGPRHPLLDAVGLGVERSFRRHRGDVARQVLLRLQALDDLLAREALGDGHLVLDRLAFGQNVDDLANARVRLDQVFAVLQDLLLRSDPALGEEADHERPPVGDDAVLLQELGDLVAAQALGHDHGARNLERARTLELVIEQRRKAQAGEHEREREREQRAAEADERSHGGRPGAAVALARRSRRARRLEHLGRAARTNAASAILGLQPRRPGVAHGSAPLTDEAVPARRLQSMGLNPIGKCGESANEPTPGRAARPAWPLRLMRPGAKSTRRWSRRSRTSWTAPY